jgi:uncharacterized delta-60 repeat protein
MSQDEHMAGRPSFGALTGVWAIALVLALVEPAQAADGDLDPTFGGGDGIVTVDFGGRNRFDAVAIQPADGKIVAAGSVGLLATRDFAVARFNPDGSLDASFDGDGIATLDVSGTSVIDAARALALQADGKIVLCGESGAPDPDIVQFAVARFTANGSPDSDFGNNGRVLTPFPGGRSMAVKCAIQPGDGKIVVAGEFRLGSGADGDVALARYNPDGSLDTGFNGNGLVTTSVFPTGPERARDVAIQSDGKIVAVGFGTQISDDPEDSQEPLDDVLVLRYNPNGSLDSGFDGDGVVITDFGANRDDQAAAVIVQPDGKLVVAGHSEQVFALARFNPDGSLDAGFGRDANGKETTDFPDGTGGRALALVRQPGGKLVAAGIRELGNFDGPAEFALVRYQPNGREDTTFGGDLFGENGLEEDQIPDGIVFTSFGPSTNARASGLALQADGKLVAAGVFNPNSPNFPRVSQDFALTRYQSSVIPEDVSCQGRAPTVIGTPGADTLVGTGRDDVIAALDGDDTVIAQGGNDVICAGAGADLVFGGSGGDAIEGNEGDDRLVGELPFVDRSPGDDVLVGDDGDDQLFGDLGNDVLEGGAGQDQLEGDAGNDTLGGGPGNDKASGGSGDDELFGGPGRDRLVGDLPGESGRDRMSGGPGNDILFGGDGNDRLFGNGGIDTLLGEGGSKDRGNGGSGRNVCFTVERIDSGSCVKADGKPPKRPRFTGPTVCNFPQCGF